MVPGIEDQQPSGLTYELQMAIEDADEDEIRGKIVFKDLDEECGDLDCVREEMRRSTFCLCPGGDYEGWSLRLYHAITAGCIPVIFADQAELPFAELIDYSKFSVKILEKDAADFPRILGEMKEERVRSKRHSLKQIADRFSWQYLEDDPKAKGGPPQWKPSSALDSLLQVLHLKLRYMRNSPYNFWLKADA